MTETDPAALERAVFQRILVALDASEESVAALEVAAEMAKRVQAELFGLFVEDANLLKLVQHPFAREVDLATRSGRTLDPATVERELKAQAATARRALERAAEQLHVPWSFRVTRGAVEAELIAAAVGADLVAVGKAIRPFTARARLGRTVRALYAGCSCSLLFAVPDTGGSATVVLAYDGSPVAAKALEVASRIADNDGGRLLVFLIAESGDAVAEHEAAVRRCLRGSALSLMFRRVSGESCAAMLPAIEAERPKLFIVGADPANTRSEALAPIIESVSCPVLLVRRGKKAG
jgi:nucleotide-binding universal stress UspA family protein